MSAKTAPSQTVAQIEAAQFVLWMIATSVVAAAVGLSAFIAFTR